MEVQSEKLLAIDFDRGQPMRHGFESGVGQNGEAGRSRHRGKTGPGKESGAARRPAKSQRAKTNDRC
jgi:hypothetical protein